MHGNATGFGEADVARWMSMQALCCLLACCKEEFVPMSAQASLCCAMLRICLPFKSQAMQGESLTFGDWVALKPCRMSPSSVPTLFSLHGMFAGVRLESKGSSTKSCSPGLPSIHQRWF